MRPGFRRQIFRIVVTGCLLAGAAMPSRATPVRRRVLALFKSSEGDQADRNQTLALLEQPLESLGCVVDYVDVDKGLPVDDEMDAYRGVVTFFRGSEMDHAAEYATWVARQVDAGRRFVIFGEYGALEDRSTHQPLSHAQVNAALGKIGLRYDGFETANPALISLISASPAMSFEEPFTQTSVDSYMLVRPLTASATAYLTLLRTDLADSTSTAVVATAHGGFAMGGALLYEYRQAGLIKQRWHLDPYAFLSDALGLADQPRLDAASLNGRRLWMAHIDGDGFLSPADGGRLCGQAMIEDVLSKYPMPVSAAIISSDIERDGRAPGLARRLFALPTIEAASHSASHPMDWTSRGVDPVREVQDSVEALNRLTPPGKRVRLITWSGLCNPPASALQAAEALGLANINGINADSGFVGRFDELYPSRTHLGPMVRHVGGMLQFNHRDANDFDLTDKWSDNRRGGYRDILTTFEKTASRPERPVNVYVHFYSAQVPESEEALRAVLDWSANQPVARIFVSDYGRLVEDFRSAEIERAPDGRVVVRNAGHCRTIVFPDATRRVDFARSENVIGFAPRQGNLYVFLDGADRHVIALTSARPATLYVEAAQGWIDRWATDGRRASFDLRAFGPTEISLGVPADGYYRLTARPADALPGRRDFTAVVRARSGRVPLTVPATGNDLVTVEPSNAAGALAHGLRFPALALSLAAFPVWFFVRARRRITA